MHQDATWYGGRPRLRRLCVRWGPSYPQKKGTHTPPNFWPMSIVAKQLDGSGRHLVRNTASKNRRCGAEIDLGPGHIVLDGVPALHKRGTAAPSFRPMSIVARSPISSTAELLYKRSSKNGKVLKSTDGDWTELFCVAVPYIRILS